MELHERIAAVRKMKGLTQEQLGELVDVSRQAVSKWESGQTVPDALTVARLCQALDVSADYVLLGKEPEELRTVEELPGFQRPEECPVCGRIAEGNVCVNCGYTIPVTPPKGPRYAVVTGGSFTIVSERVTAEAELIKYGDLSPEEAHNRVVELNNYGRILVRRNLDDRAAQWLSAHIDRGAIMPRIVEDCGESEEELVQKKTAMETPPAAKPEKSIGGCGTVLLVAAGVILALVVLSLF